MRCAGRKGHTASNNFTVPFRRKHIDPEGNFFVVWIVFHVERLNFGRISINHNWSIELHGEQCFGPSIAHHPDIEVGGHSNVRFILEPQPHRGVA